MATKLRRFRLVLVLMLLPTAVWSEQGQAPKPAKKDQKKSPNLDPSSYLLEKELANQPPLDKIKQSRVYINGVAYRKFETDAGNLYVLDKPHLDVETIRNDSTCGVNADEKLEATPVSVETGGDTRLFASVVFETIKARCGALWVTPDPNNPPAPMTQGHLDLGVSKTTKDDKRSTTEYKIYNRDLQPNINFQMNK